MSEHSDPKRRPRYSETVVMRARKYRGMKMTISTLIQGKPNHSQLATPSPCW
jgi:hypothetical protein